MTSTAGPRRSASTTERMVAGSVLVGFGLLLWALYRVLAGGEAHSYVPGKAQSSVRLQRGAAYWLAVPGGLRHLRRESDGNLQCSLVTADAGSITLRLADEASGTKLENAVAEFVSPVSGSARVSCLGVFDVYVDNATTDPSGWALIVATISLAVGVPFLVSAGYTRWQERPRVDPATYRLPAPLS